MTTLSLAFLALAAVSYFCGSLCYAGGLAMRTRQMVHWGQVCLVVGALTHAAALSSQSVSLGRVPVATSLEFLGLAALIVVIAYLVFERRLRLAVVGTIVAPLTLIAVVVATVVPSESDPLLASLHGTWLPIHITASIAGYAFVVLANSTATLYLFEDHLLRAKRPFVLTSLLPALPTLDRLSYRLVAVAFPFLTVVIVSGLALVTHEHGTPWVWDPKYVMALATWLLFGVYLAVHSLDLLRGRRAAWLIVSGFVTLLVTVVGVNRILPGGLHDF